MDRSYYYYYLIETDVMRYDLSIIHAHHHHPLHLLLYKIPSPILSIHSLTDRQESHPLFLFQFDLLCTIAYQITYQMMYQQ